MKVKVIIFIIIFSVSNSIKITEVTKVNNDDKTFNTILKEHFKALKSSINNLSQGKKNLEDPNTEDFKKKIDLVNTNYEKFKTDIKPLNPSEAINKYFKDLFNYTLKKIEIYKLFYKNYSEENAGKIIFEENSKFNENKNVLNDHFNELNTFNQKTITHDINDLKVKFEKSLDETLNYVVIEEKVKNNVIDGYLSELENNYNNYHNNALSSEKVENKYNKAIEFINKFRKVHAEYYINYKKIKDIYKKKNKITTITDPNSKEANEIYNKFEKLYDDLFKSMSDSIVDQQSIKKFKKKFKTVNNGFIIFKNDYNYNKFTIKLLIGIVIISIIFTISMIIFVKICSKKNDDKIEMKEEIN